MSITVIKGPSGSGRFELAQVLRNTAIMNGRGALILGADVSVDADVKVLIEKLISGDKFPDDVSSYTKTERVDGRWVVSEGVEAIEWKKDPQVICIDQAGLDVLGEVEQLVPGFTEKFGPATSIATEVEEIDVAPNAVEPG